MTKQNNIDLEVWVLEHRFHQAQQIQGVGDANATRIYGSAYNENPEFYAFQRTLESYKESNNEHSVLILTTDSDFYKYVKQANAGLVTDIPSVGVLKSSAAKIIPEAQQTTVRNDGSLVEDIPPAVEASKTEQQE